MLEFSFARVKVVGSRAARRFDTEQISLRRNEVYGRPSSRCLLYLAGVSLVLLCSCSKQPKSGEVQDEALRAGRAPSTFPAADEDYFHDMDGGLTFTGDEIKGRNMWIVWTGGNDRLWEEMTERERRHARFSENVVVVPGTQVQPR